MTHRRGARRPCDRADIVSDRRERAWPTARSASVKDVAARAGVSLGTVSNVLNRPERVAPATRHGSSGAIAELGFVRNESARQLRAGHQPHASAYVVLDVANPFFTDVAQGVEDAAERAGLSLFLCNSAQQRRRASAATSTCSRSSGCRAS